VGRQSCCQREDDILVVGTLSLNNSLVLEYVRERAGGSFGIQVDDGRSS
jgi:hypothetical protein